MRERSDKATPRDLRTGGVNEFDPSSCFLGLYAWRRNTRCRWRFLDRNAGRRGDAAGGLRRRLAHHATHRGSGRPHDMLVEPWVTHLSPAPPSLHLLVARRTQGLRVALTGFSRENTAVSAATACCVMPYLPCPQASLLTIVGGLPIKATTSKICNSCKG
jgi:hypothetical protein